ncbi:hypothetical protein [Deinococcus sp. Leaf326]|uniref:hypothetical protein n=1 Tax=Deinococcus sp. Leaf326 TaxID=1736338 RepID=UPI0012E0CB2C|nr:hypothetical protein [Deinococcus sp. Leaf326]
MAENTGLVFYAPIISATLTLFNVIIGGLALWVNNNAASNREKRKEIRGRIDSMLKRVEEAEKSGINFHLEESFRESEAQNIRWELEKLGKIIQTIPFLKINSNINDSYNSFKQSITLVPNFSRKDFRQQSADDSLVTTIHMKSADLIHEIERAYDSKYPIK